MSLSPYIHFGTSTWAYEGWNNVYKRTYAKGRFKRECLAEYCGYEYRGERLFRTVGVDQTFYRPPSEAQLLMYAEQLPPDFPMVFKVWEYVTVPVYANHPQYGVKASQRNRHFLDAQVMINEVLPAYGVFRSHTGALIFEFQKYGLDPEDFLPKLDHFLSQLPSEFRYAIEVRNPAVLGERYWSILHAHGAGHVYSHSTYLPRLLTQHECLGKQFSASFVVFRLLTPLGMPYAKAVERAAPYDRLVEVLPEMRADTLTLLEQSVAEQRPAYVLVNNRAEGSAPLTIQALVDQLREVR